MKELTHERFKKVGSEWKKLIYHKHVQAMVEDKFLEQDGLHEEFLDEFVIPSDSSDNESSEEDSVGTSGSSGE